MGIQPSAEPEKNKAAGGLLAEALAMHKAGRLAEAEARYRDVLALDDRNVQALTMFGTLLGQRGVYAAACPVLEASLALNPDQPLALNSFGTVLNALGRYGDALVKLDHASALKPNDPAIHNNRGNALRGLKRSDEALAAYARATAVSPTYAKAHVNRANLLAEQGNHSEALESYERALDLGTVSAELYNNYANALGALERYDEALAQYEKATELAPDNAEIHFNLGNALRSCRRWTEAIARYDTALALRPDFAEAHSNKALTLDAMARPAEAVVSYDAALALKAGDAILHRNRALALRRLNRCEDALESFDRALQLDPALPYAPGERLATKMRMCRWDGLEEEIAALREAVSRDERVCAPFWLLTFGASPALQRKCAELYVRDKFKKARPEHISAQRRGSERARIRVAYLSADFHAHATSYLMAGVFEHHKRLHFDTFAISFGPDDGSDMRRRLERAFDTFIDVSTKTDEQIATLLRAHSIDIAVDLKGFTQHSRPEIFAQRVAPIQVNYLGYPGTTGADYMDYIIADRIVVPEEHQRFYSEKVVYLPDSYQCNDSARTITQDTPSRAALGLPEQDFVFCCFNANYKITPAVFDIWMRLLDRVEGSVLWLLQSNASAARYLRREAERRNIKAERLIFAPPLPLAEHLARLRAADLFLDTLPCGAHTTASDALWAGLPVLTELGDSFAGRVAASLLHAVGLPDLVTQSDEDYEGKAFALATDRAALAALRERLQHNRDRYPLFDTYRFTRYLDAAFKEMMQRHRRGEPPAAIDLARYRADVQ